LANAIYSLNNNGKSDTFVSSTGLFAHNSSSNPAFTKPWILDNGATDHISNVNLPTGSTAPISSTTTIKFNDKITLKDVLCVPSFNQSTKLLCRFYSTWLRFAGLGYGEDD